MSTGYDKPEVDRAPEDSGYDTYTVNRQTIASHDPKPVAVIMRNQLAFGYIPCDSEEEFEWIKDRMTGSRPRS